MIKRFAYTLLRFSFLPLLALLLLEGVIALRKKNLLSERKMEKVFQHNGAAYAWTKKITHPHKIVLLGSSSVKYGLSCQRMNHYSHDTLSFINLAADARDPVETYFLLQQVDLTHVKTACYGIDPWIFTKAYYRNRHPYLYLDMDLPAAAKYSLEHEPQIFPKRYKALFGSLFGTSGKARTRFPTGQPIPPDLGSASLNKTPVNFNDPVHKKFQLDKYGWSDLQFEYLQKIVALCQSKNISFVAFWPPRRSDFILDYNTHCKEIHASFLEKLKTAGYSYPIRGSHDLLKEYGDNIFADAYHLNGKGQDVYSSVFISFYGLQ